MARRNRLHLEKITTGGVNPVNMDKRINTDICLTIHIARTQVHDKEMFYFRFN